MLVIGHRGAAGHEPENTLRSFRRALEMGVDAVECDVQICATGELVVIHDPHVDRTTDGKGRVGALSFSTLRTLDAGKGEQIPTLYEVMQIVHGKCALIIELKGEGTAGPTAAILHTAIATGDWDPSTISVNSFDRTELKDFKRAAPDIPAALTTLHPLVSLSRALEIGIYGLHSWEKFTTRSYVARAHAAGLRVYAWTVNETERIAKMFDLGVDGIFSDFPDRVLDYKKQHL